MQNNSSCSVCSHEAVHCCLCLPARIYLCETCLPWHTSKKDVLHLLAPANLPLNVDKTNLEDYFRRVTNIRKLKENVEVARTYLTEERSKLDQAFIDFHEEMKTRLHQACFEVFSDISARYESLGADLDSFSEDLIKAEEGIDLSETSKSYVQKGFHITQPSAFIDVEEEMRRRIVISAGEGQNLSLREVMEKWSNSSSSCQECKMFRETLNVEETASYWTCPTCGFAQNSVATSICAMCPVNSTASQSEYPSPAQPELAFSQYSGFVLPAQNPNFWTCIGCQYAENPIETSICQNCHSSPAPPRFSKSVQNEPLKPLADMPLRNTWTCFNCKNINSSKERACQKCLQIPGSLPADVVPCGSCGKICGGKCKLRTQVSEPEKAYTRPQAAGKKSSTTRPKMPQKK